MNAGILRLEQRRDRGGVRRGGRRPEELAAETARARHGHTVGGREIGLLQARARPSTRQLPGVMAVPSPSEKDPPRAIRAERLHDVARAERIRDTRHAGVHGGDAERERWARRIVPVCLPAVAIDNRPRLVFRCRNRPAAPVFFTTTMRGLAGAAAHLLVRILGAGLEIRRARERPSSRRC